MAFTRLLCAVLSGGAVAVLGACAGKGEKTAAVAEAPSEVFAAEGVVERVVWASGLSCPQCSSNINMAIKRLDGVEGVTVDLESGRIGVTVDPNFGPSAERVARAVRDAGFDVVRVGG
ncbi:MAG: heavy-metal-associated domain-containing protein [Phycisphaeraceae bacterium]|nr:heavy-metal-associated domain-containing protein [Phycisphaeraceae bacterium]MCW5753688.1 heavy-metal-associated domain-containing protein [Phycisphaeraceae bacterium]